MKTKLQMCKILLPLVVKLQAKGINVTIHVPSQNISVTHFIKNSNTLHTIDIWDCEPETHEAKFNKILTYLKTL